MIDALVHFLFEVVVFYLGRLYLSILTLGRYRPKLDDRNQPMVSLFGGIITLAIFIGIGVWLNRQ